MLGKLIRMEMKATLRHYAALYAVVLILLATIVAGVLFKNEMVAFLTMIFSFLLSIVVLTVTVVFIIQRYAQNLFGVEGHFMHTLPAGAGQLLAAKTLVSALWLLLSYIVLIGNYALLYWAGSSLIQDFVEGFRTGFETGFTSISGGGMPTGDAFLAYLPYMAVYLLLALFVTVMMYYFSVTVANTLPRRRRVLTGILVFLGLTLVYNGLYFGISALVPASLLVNGETVLFRTAPVFFTRPFSAEGFFIAPAADLMMIVFFIVITMMTRRLLEKRLSQRG